MIKAKCIAWTAFIVIGQLGISMPAFAQTGIVPPEVKCVDTCQTGFNQCMGTTREGGELVPLCPEGPCDGAGTVPTPPPYVFCMAEKQTCEAQCTITWSNENQSQP